MHKVPGLLQLARELGLQVMPDQPLIPMISTGAVRH
jgi:hypothetical protein